MAPKHFHELLAEIIADHGPEIEDVIDLPVSGRQFTELLLLALIRARLTEPPAKGMGEEEKRQMDEIRRAEQEKHLAVAMRAVFGSTHQLRSDQRDDSVALTLMGQWHEMDRKEDGRRSRSIDELAEKALDHASLGTGPRIPSVEFAAKRRLIDKFRAQRMDILSRSSELFVVADTLQRQALADIGEILRPFGVGFLPYE